MQIVYPLAEYIIFDVFFLFLVKVLLNIIPVAPQYNYFTVDKHLIFIRFPY